MQNKPNFMKGRNDAKYVFKKDYENKSNWTLGENKPNSNPIKANKMPKQTQTNPIQTQFFLTQPPQIHILLSAKKN
ncbi:MAG: hypothetical protein ACYS8Y_12910 [Planctomycetota bacterium]|jgi:hypothetical protein